MSTSYTGVGLQARKQWAESAVADVNMDATGRAVAWRELRYHATLAQKDELIGDMQASLDGLDDVLIAKDAQIKKLAETLQMTLAARDYRVNSPGYNMAWQTVQDMIREATK